MIRPDKDLGDCPAHAVPISHVSDLLDGALLATNGVGVGLLDGALLTTNGVGVFLDSALLTTDGVGTLLDGALLTTDRVGTGHFDLVGWLIGWGC